MLGDRVNAIRVYRNIYSNKDLFDISKRHIHTMYVFSELINLLSKYLIVKRFYLNVFIYVDTHLKKLLLDY